MLRSLFSRHLPQSSICHLHSPHLSLPEQHTNLETIGPSCPLECLFHHEAKEDTLQRTAISESWKKEAHLASAWTLPHMYSSNNNGKRKDTTLVQYETRHTHLDINNPLFDPS